MDDLNSIVIQKNYGRVVVRLAQRMEQLGLTRNRLRTLTGIKYDVIDRYYKGEGVERVDLDFLAKVCFVMDCDVTDLLEYQREKIER